MVKNNHHTNLSMFSIQRKHLWISKTAPRERENKMHHLQQILEDIKGPYATQVLP